MKTLLTILAILLPLLTGCFQTAKLAADGSASYWAVGESEFTLTRDGIAVVRNQDTISPVTKSIANTYIGAGVINRMTAATRDVDLAREGTSRVGITEAAKTDRLRETETTRRMFVE